MVNKKHKRLASVWVITAAYGITAVIVVAALLLWKSDKNINSFQACKDAGGAIMESFPEQCSIQGQSFANDSQSVDGSAKGYVGLTEQAALAKAKNESKAARVVDRDGESLPVDASFNPGRLNFYVKDGKVYKVDIEGVKSQAE